MCKTLTALTFSFLATQLRVHARENWASDEYEFSSLHNSTPASAFLYLVSSFTWLGGMAEEMRRNILWAYSCLIMRLPISLQPRGTACVDACYLQTAAVCQRYDYMEWHKNTSPILI